VTLPKLRVLHLRVSPSIDGILAGEGMDPAVARSRRPVLVKKAEEALAVGMPLVKGVVFQRDIGGLPAEMERDAGAEALRNLLEVFAGQKFTPERMVVMACTIGRELELSANRVINEDRLLGLALEGLANDAINRLSVQAIEYSQKKYCAHSGLACWTIAPGMAGWEREVGQRVLFGILRPPEKEIQLLPGGQMLPLKSLSVVIGFGRAGRSHPAHCEECQVRATCAYQHLHTR
jgi:hypothetical protein